MDRRASRHFGFPKGGFHPPESDRKPRATEAARRGSKRVSARARARAGHDCVWGGWPIVSRTPVVEWSGCGDAYRAPGVAAPRPVAAAPCSRVSCTWTNARSAAAAAANPAAAGPRRSSAAARCSRVRCIRCSSGSVVRDRPPLLPPRPSAATVRRIRNPARIRSEARPREESEGKYKRHGVVSDASDGAFLWRRRRRVYCCCWGRLQIRVGRCETADSSIAVILRKEKEVRCDMLYSIDSIYWPLNKLLGHRGIHFLKA